MSNVSLKQQLMKAAEDHKEDARQNAKNIRYESFGADKNKKKKNQQSCDRGTSSGPARYCSRHLREQIYPQSIIGDKKTTEYCVCGRQTSDNNNPCNLCNINTQHYVKTTMINFGEAINSLLDGNHDKSDVEKYNRRVLSFMSSHIGSNYPGTGNERSVLRIKVNGQIWMEYYIKLTAFSSLLKTSAPSGYKYKDRISLGRMIRIQSKQNTDLIFYITKDREYSDPEFEESRPVVNGVGWWDLLKPAKNGDIRNIIHLNNDQAVHVSFGFLVNKQHNIKSIEVELVCTRHSLSMQNTVLPLWSYPEIEEETKSNGSNVSLSSQMLIQLLPPIPPQPVTTTRYNHYPSTYGPITTHNNQLYADGQIINYEPVLNRSYSASHCATNNVQQIRHSPYANMSVHSYISMPCCDDEYKMEPIAENQNESSFTNDNMYYNYDAMIPDDTSTVNGMMFDKNMIGIFPDYMSIV